LARGDVFIVKLAPQEQDEQGWTAYEDFSPEFLEYCLARNKKEIESYLHFRYGLAAQNALFPGIWADHRSQWLDMIYREHRSHLAVVDPVQD
jgi:hypothetical protein